MFAVRLLPISDIGYILYINLIAPNAWHNKKNLIKMLVSALLLIKLKCHTRLWGLALGQTVVILVYPGLTSCGYMIVNFHSWIQWLVNERYPGGFEKTVIFYHLPSITAFWTILLRSDFISFWVLESLNWFDFFPENLHCQNNQGDLTLLEISDHFFM